VGWRVVLLGQESGRDLEAWSQPAKGRCLQGNLPARPQYFPSRQANFSTSPPSTNPPIKSVSCSTESSATQQDTHSDKSRPSTRSPVVTKPLSLIQLSPCHLHAEDSLLGASLQTKTFLANHKSQALAAC